MPEPALSASLAALLPRMKGIEATQAAQRAEMAELRARSEACIRQWYEHSIVGYSDFVATSAVSTPHSAQASPHVSDEVRCAPTRLPLD